MSKVDQPPAWRTLGFWLALVILLLQAFNAARAFLDPAGFANYLGLPLAAGADPGWVSIYGLRTLFIALVVAGLLLRGELGVLAWVALAGVVMPVGDAWLTHQAGAPVSIVARHAAIAIYLIVTAVVLARSARRMSTAAAS